MCLTSPSPHQRQDAKDCARRHSDLSGLRWTGTVDGLLERSLGEFVFQEAPMCLHGITHISRLMSFLFADAVYPDHADLRDAEKC